MLASTAQNVFGFQVISWLLLGAFIQPLVPVSLEHAAELTYPIPADTSSAVLQTGANSLALFITFSLNPLLNYDASASCSSVITPAAGLLFILMVVGCVCALPLTSDNRRLAVEGVGPTATDSSSLAAWFGLGSPKQAAAAAAPGKEGLEVAGKEASPVSDCSVSEEGDLVDAERVAAV